MLILAIDTAHKNGSLTLAQADNNTFNALQTVAIDGGAFSAQLIPRLADALAANHFAKTDIDAYIACVGPGSFTGLRIGLSGIKGLEEVLPRPIAAVSSLEALAASAPANHSHLAALLDAGRSEFYVGEYRREADNLLRESEALCTADELQSLLKKGSTAIASQPNVAELARSAGASVIEVPEVDSVQIARVGWRKLLAGETISADLLDANYLRRDESLFAR
ncbi:MAG TPA: tRNA (adenosine(37)-N6)-threonylcarbamoyltransferase complex dimerization subunit type 1 TsaB [Terriglobales bacterium]|nr:tRNA (adenosine(37)-N6)-threonylcarbamoyltransferase complex dimerization subunit type 1 TsaB [Terriglobales bacterium]